MTKPNEPRTDQWTDFAGKYLKAEHISVFPITLVCNNVSAYFDEDSNAHLILEFVYNSKKWKWECNKTNQKFIKDAGLKSPVNVLMKKITFDKIKVRNPTTKQLVDSLSIIKIE